MLAATKYFCCYKTRDKHTVVAAKDVFCRDKSKLVETKKHVWRTHTFVVTKDVFCRDKSFVATKMILLAAPANDTPPPPSPLLPRLHPSR